MRRGLTMLELLVAVSLLAMLMLGVASWIQVTARAGAAGSEPGRWRGAAQAVLQLIHDDLVTGDLGAAGREKPVEIVDRVLVVRTRVRVSDDAVGPIAHRYKFDTSSNTLKLEQRLANGRRTTRPLLDDVGEWKCSIDDQRTTLTVTIARRDSDTGAVERRYQLP